MRETAQSKSELMATSMITSPLLVPTRAKGLPSISRRGSSFAIVCSGGKKIKTDKPYGLYIEKTSSVVLHGLVMNEFSALI